MMSVLRILFLTVDGGLETREELALEDLALRQQPKAAEVIALSRVSELRNRYERKQAV